MNKVVLWQCQCTLHCWSTFSCNKATCEDRRQYGWWSGFNSVEPLAWDLVHVTGSFQLLICCSRPDRCEPNAALAHGCPSETVCRKLQLLGRRDGTWDIDFERTHDDSIRFTAQQSQLAKTVINLLSKYTKLYDYFRWVTRSSMLKISWPWNLS